MNFDEFCGSVKVLAGRAARKINETADVAALQLKLTAAEGKLEEAYALLGRTSYLHFTGEEDLSDRVAIAVENVEAARKPVRELKKQIEELKEKNREKNREKSNGASDGE